MEDDMKAKIHVKLENGEAYGWDNVDVFLVDPLGEPLPISLADTEEIPVKEILIKPVSRSEVILNAHKLYVES